jgi:hypothetical protein
LCRSPPPILQIGFEELTLRTSVCRHGIKIVFGLDVTVASDVKHRHSAVSQHSPDEEVAVALQRILFATEQCNTVVPSPSKYPVNPSLERLGTSDLVVANVILLIVKLIAIWPTAELPAERDIFDLLLQECFPERSCIEVRDIARPR